MYEGRIKTENKAATIDPSALLLGKLVWMSSIKTRGQTGQKDNRSCTSQRTEGVTGKRTQIKAAHPGERVLGKARDLQDPLHGHPSLGRPEGKQNQHSY